MLLMLSKYFPIAVSPLNCSAVHTVITALSKTSIHEAIRMAQYNNEYGVISFVYKACDIYLYISMSGAWWLHVKVNIQLQESNYNTM
jgi:hypothetical protein